MADSQSTEQAAKAVPFVGWSHAAANFRQLASMNAPAGMASVLILGPTGVGKKTMAKVWQHLASQNGQTLPIINLDNDRTKIPRRCIGISTRGLPENATCLHLDKGEYRPLTPDGAAGVISETDALRFPLKIYNLPLRFRRVDILALLEFFILHTLPKLAKCTYSSVCWRFDHTIRNGEWDGNAQELLNILVAAVNRDLPATRLSDNSTINLGQLSDPRPQSFDAGTEFLAERRAQIHERIARGEVPDTSLWRELYPVQTSQTSKLPTQTSQGGDGIDVTHLRFSAIKEYADGCESLLVPNRDAFSRRLEFEIREFLALCTPKGRAS